MRSNLKWLLGLLFGLLLAANLEANDNDYCSAEDGRKALRIIRGAYPQIFNADSDMGFVQTSSLLHFGQTFLEMELAHGKFLLRTCPGSEIDLESMKFGIKHYKMMASSTDPIENLGEEGKRLAKLKDYAKRYNIFLSLLDQVVEQPSCKIEMEKKRCIRPLQDPKRSNGSFQAQS